MKNQAVNDVIKHHQIPLFKGLNGDVIQDILSKSFIKNYKKGEIIFFKDTKILNIPILLTGLIKLCDLNSEGTESLILIEEDGDVIIDIFSNFSPFNIIATKDSVVLFIEAENFRKIVQNNMYLMRNVIDDLSQKNRYLLNHISRLKLSDAKARIGQFLLELAFKKGQKAMDFDIKIDKMMMASYLGIRPETLSRALKKLKNEGEIFVENNKIILLNQTSLCQYCNKDVATKCTNYNPDKC